MVAPVLSVNCQSADFCTGQETDRRFGNPDLRGKDEVGFPRSPKPILKPADKGSALLVRRCQDSDSASQAASGSSGSVNRRKAAAGQRDQ